MAAPTTRLIIITLIMTLIMTLIRTLIRTPMLGALALVTRSTKGSQSAFFDLPPDV